MYMEQLQKKRRRCCEIELSNVSEGGFLKTNQEDKTTTPSRMIQLVNRQASGGDWKRMPQEDSVDDRRSSRCSKAALTAKSEMNRSFP